MNQVKLVIERYGATSTNDEPYLKLMWDDTLQKIKNIAQEVPVTITIKIELNQDAVEQSKEEPPTQPHPIDGPGWYRTQDGKRARIRGCDSAGHEWYGYVEDGGDNLWKADGTDYEGYTPWMIVAKEA